MMMVKRWSHFHWTHLALTRDCICHPAISFDWEPISWDGGGDDDVDGGGDSMKKLPLHIIWCWHWWCRQCRWWLMVKYATNRCQEDACSLFIHAGTFLSPWCQLCHEFSKICREMENEVFSRRYLAGRPWKFHSCVICSELNYAKELGMKVARQSD